MAGQTDHLAGAVANGADPMQRAFYPRAIVVAERADVVDDVRDVGFGDLAVEQVFLAGGEAGLWPTAEIHHDL